MNIKIISLIVSIFIISLLYWQINITELLAVFLNSNFHCLSWALLLVIPITLISAFRLTFLSMDSNKIGYIDSIKLILAACVMNLVLPSKMGDLAKCVFIVRNRGIKYDKALPLVTFEKMSDVLALLLWCITGLICIQNHTPIYLTTLVVVCILFIAGVGTIFTRSITNIIVSSCLIVLPKRYAGRVKAFQNGWHETIDVIKNDTKKILALFALSTFLWFLHLFQIWLFISSLNSDVSLLLSLSITPIAIFAGLMPFTFSGIGTRDAAFIYFYSNYFPETTGAALGILATLRYIIPAIVGIPFFSYYFKRINE